MPPKKATKSEKKKAEKVIEDKTFGLKNKNKSKVVQNYIKGVQTQVYNKFGQKVGDAKKLEEMEKKKALAKEEEKQQLLSSLFKSVKRTNAISSSESESEEEEEESGQIDIYTDQRDQLYKADDMGNWDQETLEKAVAEKEKREKQKNKTDKICKFFLDAIEKRKYGWRWVCPNGMDCIYKHCLPPGYVLKKDEVPVEVDTTPLEEQLEEERSQLQGGTPVTLERFLKWKEEKAKAREAEWEAKRLEEEKKTGGRGISALSGKALFAFDQNLFKDDDNAVDEYEEEKEDEKENGEEKEDKIYDDDKKAEKEENVQINKDVFDADVELPDDDDDDQ